MAANLITFAMSLLPADSGVPGGRFSAYTGKESFEYGELKISGSMTSRTPGWAAASATLVRACSMLAALSPPTSIWMQAMRSGAGAAVAAGAIHHIHLVRSGRYLQHCAGCRGEGGLGTRI